MSKVCTICGQHKPLSLFYKNPHMADGHSSECRQCRTVKVADHRERYNRLVQDNNELLRCWPRLTGEQEGGDR